MSHSQREYMIWVFLPWNEKSRDLKFHHPSLSSQWDHVIGFLTDKVEVKSSLQGWEDLNENMYVKHLTNNGVPTNSSYYCYYYFGVVLGK